MTYTRPGCAHRLALELEARSWAAGAGLTSVARADEAWRELSAQLFRMEAEIVRLRGEIAAEGMGPV